MFTDLDLRSAFLFEGGWLLQIHNLTYLLTVNCFPFQADPKDLQSFGRSYHLSSSLSEMAARALANFILGEFDFFGFNSSLAQS
jgi:hypothetical protein